MILNYSLKYTGNSSKQLQRRFFSRTNESSAETMMRRIADEAEHIYLAFGVTDFHKQQNGLAILISLKFKLDPYCGKSVFLFCNKKHSSLKALRWDGGGFILVTKFLSDEMKFQWPKNRGEVRTITKRQLEWLLQGLQVEQKKAHKESIHTEGMIF